MKANLRNLKILSGGLLFFWVTSLLAQSGNIDATDKWAWGINIGWIDFRPTHGGVTVYNDHLEG